MATKDKGTKGSKKKKDDTANTPKEKEPKLSSSRILRRVGRNKRFKGEGVEVDK